MKDVIFFFSFLFYSPVIQATAINGEPTNLRVNSVLVPENIPPSLIMTNFRMKVFSSRELSVSMSVEIVVFNFLSQVFTLASALKYPDHMSVDVSMVNLRRVLFKSDEYFRHLPSLEKR